MRISTDYLVVGAGTSGLAFTDTLVAGASAEVLVVDRNDAPGGHWVHAYPFVRLHSPSWFYGVDSLHLGQDRLDEDGLNTGLYERATKPELTAYFAEVAARLVATGQVRLLLGHEVSGSHQEVRNLHTGEVHEIEVRRAVVDARYLEASVPATHRPSYEVADDAFFVPVGGMPDGAGAADRFVVLGSGKTAADACLWLLEQGTDPGRISWVRPRDAWWHDRAAYQGLDQVADTMDMLATDAEAGALATSLADLQDRLEKSGSLLRLDANAPATMYRGGMLSAAEATELRRIEDVVRLGHVRRVERDRILLEAGRIATGPGVLVVDGTARGLRDAPPLPIWAPGRIVLQQVRHNSPPFNAALIGFVEAHRSSDEEKNALCPPNPFAGSIADYPAMIARTWRAEGPWLAEPDLRAWVGGTRLNLTRDLRRHGHEPRVRDAVGRFLTHVGAAIENLPRLS